MALIPLGFGTGGVAMAILWWLIGLGSFSNYLYIAIILAIGGAAFGMVVALHFRLMPAGRLKESSGSL